MKIRAVTEESKPRIYAMLSLAFPKNGYEARLVQLLHENAKPIHEWVCIHSNRIIAYVALTNAYREDRKDGEDKAICGLHLAPMAVTPDFQNQGIGSELLQYALRQEAIKDQTIFVMGEPDYYRRFGFKPCRTPICPYDTNNRHFLSMRNEITESFTIGYESEFKAAEKKPKPVKEVESPAPDRQNSSKRSTKGMRSSKRRF